MRFSLVAFLAIVAALLWSYAPASAGLVETGSINGRITNALHSPIVGASVHVERTTCCSPGSGDATTGVDGTYQIDFLGGGNYSITVDADGYAAASPASPVFVSTDSVTHNVNVELTAAGRIAGRVTHGVTGIGGANVFAAPVGEFFTNSATTDVNGFFVMEDVTAGAYQVIAGKFGDVYAPEWFNNSYTRAGSTTVNVVSGLQTNNINFDLATGGSITGMITMPGGGAAANAEVSVSNGEFAGYAITDGSGDYTVTGLAAGMYTVDADDEGNSAALTYYNDKFDEASGDKVNVALGTTSTSIDIDLGAFASMSGSITGVVPLFGAAIDASRTVCCAGPGTSKSSDGPYTITDVTPGCYRVRAASWDRLEYFDNKTYEQSANVVCVSAGEAKTGINFSLTTPNNDFIDQITNIPTLPYSGSQSNAGTGVEGGEAQPCGSIGATLWYRFQLPLGAGAGATVRVTNTGSKFDTALAVYSGAAITEPPGSLSPIQCSNVPAGQETITFTGTPGSTYYVQAGGASGASGDIILNIGCGATGQDPDCDGVTSASDNCQTDYNPGQENQDGDALGDACDNDVDGDGLADDDEPLENTEELIADTDGDGCEDGAEVLQDSHGFGGQRDPLNSWDFFDVNGNGNVDLTDTLAVLAKFGALPGDALYDERFDRYIPTAHPPYLPGQADGPHVGIDLEDAQTNLLSFGEICVIPD